MKLSSEIKYLAYYGFDGTLITSPHTGSFISFFYNFNGCFFILCDSNSDSRSAAKAAEIVISGLTKFYQKRVFDDPVDTIKQALKYANQKLYFAKQRDETIFETDLQCLLVWKTENKLYYAGIGDVNLFYLKGTDIISLNSYLILNELEKKSKKQSKTELQGFDGHTGSMGDFDDVKIITCVKPIVPYAGDAILLCSKEFNVFLDKTLMTRIYAPTHTNYESFINELEYQYNLNRNTKPLKLQFVKFNYSPPAFQPTSLDQFLNTLYYIWEKIYNWKYFLHIIVSLIVLSFLFILLYNVYVEPPVYTNPIRSIDSIEIKSVDSILHGKNKDSLRIQVIHRKQINRPVRYKDTIIYYRVKRNETLSRLSVRFNLDVKSICLENKLIDQQISSGQVLRIHLRAIHKLLEGENLEVLAAYYNVSIIDLLEANDVLYEKELKTGDYLFIPRP